MNLKTKSNVNGLLFWIGFALLASTALSAQDVRYNFMLGTGFGKCYIYKWVPIEGRSHPNQIADAQVKSAVDSQLVAKGLTKTDSDNADLLIGYQVAVDKEKQWNAYSTGGFRFGGMESATSPTISNGSLVVDMYDPTSKNLFGPEPPRRHSIPAVTRKRTSRIWTRPWRSC